MSNTPPSQEIATVRLDIGIFAHDEADRIGKMLGDLALQDILSDPNFSIRVIILANGCGDRTIEEATRATASTKLDDITEVLDLKKGGKSRTWNVFVHDTSRSDADFLVFCDADIALPDTSTLRHLTNFIAKRPKLLAASSKPVKDIAQSASSSLSFVDRLTAAAGGTLNDWRTSICGQLYVLRADAARGFHLPIGLPVEDGFVRAMLTTDVLRADLDISRIDGRDEIFHVYASERRIGHLLHHQTRIVIGSAINSVLFAHLREIAPGSAHKELERAADDPDWVGRTLKAHLPTARYGYVPWHFLFKRLRRLHQQTGLKSNIIILAGFVFDALVWVNAQQRMARGTGAGYW